MKTILGILLFTVNVYAGGDGCEPTTIVKIVEKIVYVERLQEIPIEIQVQDKRKNMINVLVANGPSNKLNYNVVSPTSVQTTHEAENLIGLQYLRQTDSGLTLGAFGLSNSALGVSLGWGF
jgi:hypothetical protein